MAMHRSGAVLGTLSLIQHATSWREYLVAPAVKRTRSQESAGLFANQFRNLHHYKKSSLSAMSMSLIASFQCIKSTRSSFA
jgi:hypothetical protein